MGWSLEMRGAGLARAGKRPGINKVAWRYLSEHKTKLSQLDARQREA